MVRNKIDPSGPIQPVPPLEPLYCVVNNFTQAFIGRPQLGKSPTSRTLCKVTALGLFESRLQSFPSHRAPCNIFMAASCNLLCPSHWRPRYFVVYFIINNGHDEQPESLFFFTSTPGTVLYFSMSSDNHTAMHGWHLNR